MKHLLYIFLVLATLLTGLYLLPKHTPLFEYYRLRPVFEVATIVFLIGVLCLYGREKRQVKMIFSRLSQKNFFLDLAIQCGGIYIWEFKDEEFFFEYPVGDQSSRIELEEMWRLIHPDDLTAFKLLWQSLWKADKEVFQCRARFAGSDYKWWEFRTKGHGTVAPPSTPSELSFNDGTLFVKSDYRVTRINLADIKYIEGMSEYVRIFVEGEAKPIMPLLSMKRLEETLPPSQFMRVHRSYIVNLKKITEVSRLRIVFGETYIPVGENYKDQFTEYINSRMMK